MYRKTYTMKIFCLLYCGLILMTSFNIAAAQNAQQIAKKAFGSTVLLVMEDINGQPMSLGSGFFVKDGVIASNLHVIKGASRGFAKLLGEKTKYDIEGITAIDPDRDLVLLIISSSRALPLSLGNSDAVQVGDQVYAVGNPQGLEGTFSQGIISSIRKVGSDKLLQITAPISPGSSGGPVLDLKGEVIGVSVATFKGGQNLNFAIPSNHLKALITKSGTPKPLAGAIESKAHRSILSGLGGRNSEGIVGRKLWWSYHGNYTFSLQNRLRDNVKNIKCLVVFYDSNNEPIDFDYIHYEGIIPGGLSKRVEGKVHVTVQGFNADNAGDTASKHKIEFRIFDFEIAE
jgi:hypothetical protein